MNAVALLLCMYVRVYVRVYVCISMECLFVKGRNDLRCGCNGCHLLQNWIFGGTDARSLQGPAMCQVVSWQLGITAALSEERGR